MALKAISADPAKRVYQPIWEQLKSRQTVRLAVLPPLVARVKKAIMKEKYNDATFKFANEDDYLFLRFTYDIDKRELQVKLQARYGIEELEVTS